MQIFPDIENAASNVLPSSKQKESGSRKALTAENIRSAKVGETLWDTQVSGLHLRIQATRRSFYLYYRSASGQQRRPRLGQLGDLTLASARVLARDLLAIVARGEDPKGLKNQLREEPTVGEVYERVLQEYWSKPRFVASGWKKDVEGFWKNHLRTPFSGRKLSELLPPEIRRWHSEYEDRPSTGNRALEVLSKLFNFAESEGIRPPGSNPCRYVAGHPEVKRERYATVEELKKIAELLFDAYPKNPQGVTFLLILALTGTRPSALERATRDELTYFEMGGETFGKLTFKGKSTAKTGSDEVVIIPPQGVALLSRLPATKDGRLFDTLHPTKLWERIREKAGCPDLWARDLRRTFATVAKSNGQGDIIGELLNHRSAQTTKLYAKLMHDSRAIAVGSIATKMETIMGEAINTLTLGRS